MRKVGLVVAAQKVEDGKVRRKIQFGKWLERAPGKVHHPSGAVGEGA